ncbi:MULTISPECIES: hypothetical protein [Salibacter]|jgi:hypothetical protein|nr:MULTISPECIES: hypothetical protein [Salibacter]MDR9398665.1 hypothetical protein [Salibacter sp.]MDR9487793.1 hypothetical protein [Salibacter sp.]
MTDILYIFAILLVGMVIARFSVRKGTKPPRGGRYFKKRMEDD